MKSNKNLLCTTAFKLFLSRGYEGVSFRDIEAATGLSRGAVFYYFRSKEDLFKGVIDEFVFEKQYLGNKISLDHVNSLSDFIDAYLAGVERTKSYITDFIDGIAEKNVTRAYMFLILQATDFYPGFDKKINEIMKAETAVWENEIEKAKRSGEIKSTCDSKMYAEIFRYVFYGKSYRDALIEGLEVAPLKELLQGIYRKMLANNN